MHNAILLLLLLQPRRLSTAKDADVLAGQSLEWEPLLLNSTYFGATARTERTNSSWGVSYTGAPAPLSTRSLTFWGTFKHQCDKAWGFNIEKDFQPPFPHHQVSGFMANNHNPVGYYPQCGVNTIDYGPHIEADIIYGNSYAHWIQTISQTAGPFIPYSENGQPPSGIVIHFPIFSIAFSHSHITILPALCTMIIFFVARCK